MRLSVAGIGDLDAAHADTRPCRDSAKGGFGRRCPEGLRHHGVDRPHHRLGLPIHQSRHAVKHREWRLVSDGTRGEGIRHEHDLRRHIAAVADLLDHSIRQPDCHDMGVGCFGRRYADEAGQRQNRRPGGKNSSGQMHACLYCC